MVIYLYGPDHYRRQEKLNEYVERYKNKYASGASIFYLDKEEDWVKFKDFCKSQSLFEASKLGIIFSAGGGNFNKLEKSVLKEFISLIKENLENKNRILILNDENEPSKDFLFLLKKPVIFHKFENLKGIELKKFLDLEIKKRKIEMDADSKNLFLLIAGQSIWDMIMELDKLSLLNEKRITKKILEKYIDFSPVMDIFSNLNKIRAAHNIGSRLAILEDLFSNNNDPAMIFNMMATSPYLTKEQKIEMADYDAAVKTGNLEYDDVLLDMMLK
jgi:DNA polymerase III delta subunit